MSHEENEKPKPSTRSRTLPFRAFEEALQHAVASSWEKLSRLEGDMVRVFGVCLNDAGGTIEAHVLTQSDIRRLIEQWGRGTTEAEVCLSHSGSERRDAMTECYHEVAAVYGRILPNDLDDEAAWERIHLRVERLVLKVLREWRSLHKELEGNGPLLFLNKTAGLSDAESQAYLKVLNPPDVLEKWFGAEPVAMGKAGSPCGPENRSCRFRDMRLSPDEARLALTGWNNQLLTWWVGDTTRAERIHYIREGRAEALAWLSRNVLLVLLTKEASIHETSVCLMIDIVKGKRRVWLERENGLKWSKDLDVDTLSERVWFATRKGFLQAFTLSGILEMELAMDGGWIRCVRVSPDGRWLAACSDNFGICIWQADTLNLKYTLKGDYEHLCFSGDSRWITATSNSETLPLHQSIWELETGVLVKDLALPRLKDNDQFVSLEEARCAAFHSSKPWLAVSQGCGEGSTLLSLWDLEAGDCLGRFSNGHECVEALAWHGDNLFYTGDHGRGAALYAVHIPSGGPPSISIEMVREKEETYIRLTESKMPLVQNENSSTRKSSTARSKRKAKTSDIAAEQCVDCLCMIKGILEVWAKMQGDNRLPALDELGSYFQSGEPIKFCPMDGAPYLPPNTEIPYYHCPHESHTTGFLKLAKQNV